MDADANTNANANADAGGSTIALRELMQPFPHPSDATHQNLIKIGQLASEIFKFESVDNDEEGRLKIIR